MWMTSLDRTPGAHRTRVGAYLRDEGAGQEAHQADGGAAHGGDPAAQNVCEDTDDGRAEEDHSHGEGAHPG